MTPNMPQEQIDIKQVLGLYRTKLAEAHEAIIMLEARILARDEEIARLRQQVAGGNELPDLPYE